MTRQFHFGYNEIQDALTPVEERVVLVKSNLDNFKGHLHIDL